MDFDRTNQSRAGAPQGCDDLLTSNTAMAMEMVEDARTAPRRSREIHDENTPAGAK